MSFELLWMKKKFTNIAIDTLLTFIQKITYCRFRKLKKLIALISLNKQLKASTPFALQQNILQQADARSENIIETFVKNTGFKKVGISFRNN